MRKFSQLMRPCGQSLLLVLGVGALLTAHPVHAQGQNSSSKVTNAECRSIRRYVPPRKWSDSTGPANGSELAGFMEGYALNYEGTQCLNNVLDRIYTAQARDPQWAAPIEQVYASKVAESPSVTLLEGGGCRQSLCRYELRISGAQPFWDREIFQRKVVDSAGAIEIYFQEFPGGIVRNYV